MYSFDSKTRVLRISKVDIPKESVDRDLMRNQKDSYNLYRTTTIRKDLDYLCAIMSQYMNESVISYIWIEKPKYSLRPNNEIKRKGYEYYPVVVKFTRDGEVCTPEIEVLKIPYMDDFCVLNVEGKQKVILSEMKSLEDISFVNKDGMQLTAVLPLRQVTLKHKESGIFIKHKKTWIPIDKIILSMMRNIGDERKLEEVFYNSIMRRALIARQYLTEETILEDVEKTNIPKMLESKGYELGRLREMLNQRLTIKDCQGRVLARSITLPRSGIKLEVGSVITEEYLALLRYNCINEVLVKERPEVAGMVLAAGVRIAMLRKGIPIGSFLHERVPDLRNFSYCPEDRIVNIRLELGTVLSDSMIDALYHCGVDTIKVKPHKGIAKVVEIPFYREICGNYTIQLKHLELVNMPEHLNAEMYHYYFGQDKPWELKDIITPKHITAHDMIAMVSLLTRASADPTIPEVMHRDSDFLKKINRCNEIFSESFRLAVDEWVKKQNRKIKETLLGSDPKESFYGFYRTWISMMQNRKPLLPPVEDTNPVALLSQINRVVTITQSSNSVSDEMRTLALPYYGRICPYETPAGKNIGINNTLAIGCKVENGIPKTPYYKIIGKLIGKPRISDKVEYLTAIQEQDYRIGDRLSLQFNSDGTIKNTKVIARVKSYGTLDKTIVDTVDATTLDYVNVLPEQHCSSTAMLIPFAAANDGVRVSYGLNLIRQSIYVQRSQIPLVMTSMYKELFDYSDSYCTRALDDGTVIEVSCNALAIKYDNQQSETVHQLMETRVSNQSVVAMTFRVAPGQRVKKGDVLIDSAMSKQGYFSPGVNILCAIMPDSGYNYEDAVSLSEHISHSYISIANNQFEKELSYGTSELTSLSTDNTYQYIPMGGMIAEVNHTRADDARAPRREIITTHKEDGILYDCRLERDEDGKQKLKASLLGFNHLQEGDKMSGRHGNKGTDSRLQKTSLMPTFMNGIVCDAVFNPCGIVSRMNMGQMLDGHCGFIAYMLGIRIESDPFNGATLDDIKDLMKFVHDLAHMKDIQSVKALWGDNFPNELYECAKVNYQTIKEWEGCFFPDGSAPMWNPETGKMFENPITFGMPYYLKIVHEVEHKLHARGGMLEEDYGQIDKQPRHGAANGGGQKKGEMEMAALMAHGVANVVWESCNTLSDNIEERTNMTMEAMSREKLYPEEELHSPKSVDNWRYYSEVLGGKVESDMLAPVNYEAVKHRIIYDPRIIIKNQNRGFQQKISKTSSEELLKEWDDAF